MKKMFLVMTLLLFGVTAMNHAAQHAGRGGRRGGQEVKIDESTDMNELTVEQIEGL